MGRSISKYRAGELIAIPPGFESHNPTGPDYEYLDDVGISGPLISPKEEGKSTGRGFIKKKKDNKVSKYRKDEVVAVPPGYPTHNPSGPDYEYVTDAGISGPLISPKKPGQSTGRSFSKKAKEKASKYRTGEVVAIPPGYPTHNPSGPDYDYVTDVGISGPLIPPKKSGQSTGRSFSKKVKEKASKYRKGEVIAVPPGYPTHNPTGPDYDYVTDAGISGPLKSPKKPGQSTGRSFSKKSKASKYRAGEVVAIPPGYPTHNPTGPDYEYDTDVGISGPLIPGRKPTSTGRGMQGSESKYRPGEVVAIPPGYETHDPTGPNYEYHDDVGVSGPLIHPPGAELEAPPPSPSAPLISLKPKSPTNPNGRSILKSSHPASSPVITLEKPSSGENAVPAPTPIHKSGGIVANVFQKMETTPADEDEDLPDFDYEDDTEIKTPAPTIRIKNKLGGEPKHIFEVFDEVYSSTLLSIATTTWGGRENDDLTFPSSASSSASVESESYEYDEEFYRVFDYALSPNGEYEYDEEYDYSSSSSSSESREFRARGDDYDSSFEEYFDDEEEEESSSEEEDEISPKTRKYSSASDSGWGYASASKKEGGSRRTDFNVGELQPPPAAGRRRANYYIRA
ncbi:hypothetical protein Fcan01_18252 [Folsomia candida]|uniref:Uncharacterized protein n=1 Tax=Folsomia candida TaxID=158441 RepID=A0A226DPA2_FOLCA|nr:hypothetical protein Fcan01_18252 [Folsomia candida]